MFSSRDLGCGHEDLVHDVSYDWYGRRLATCSSDRRVKIFDYSEGDGEWELSAEWKTHSGSVWKVDWAHPEFGQVIVTCSFDRTAAVWEETAKGKWVRRANLADSRTSVTDAKFAPSRRYGLALATCSVDGVVRVYEAPDVMNLAQWSLQHEIPCKTACSCLSWSPAKNGALLAVGSDEPGASEQVVVFRYDENGRRWVKAKALSHATDPVHDIAFAPNVGRSYDVLAIASSKDLQMVALDGKNEARLAGQFDDHASQVWRVCWNVTGTILASSGDDGAVKLWKCNYLDNWRCVATLKRDGAGKTAPPVASAMMT